MCSFQIYRISIVIDSARAENPLLELDDPTRLGIHPLEWSSPSLRKRDPKHLYGMALIDWEPLSAKKHFN
jgi:hypothetical protein